MANPMFVSGWWFLKYDEYIDQNIANEWIAWVDANPVGTSNYGAFDNSGVNAQPLTADGGPNNSIFPNTSKTENDWPAFMPSDWEPATCDINDCTTIIDADFPTSNFSGGLDTAQRVYLDGNKLFGTNAFHVPAIHQHLME